MNVYLISRINPLCHSHNEHIAGLISSGLKTSNVFIPHHHNPCDVQHDSMSNEVYHVDHSAMEMSHCGCISFPIGCDCSAEVGWYNGACKPVYGLIAESSNGVTCVDQYKSLKDNWMVKGFLTKVIILKCEKTFDLCIQDPILGKKTILITSIQDLSKFVVSAVQEG